MLISEVKAFMEQNGARLHHIGILSENLEGTIDFFKNLPYMSGLEANPGGYMKKEDLLVGEPFKIRITNGVMSNNPIRMEILQPVREESDPNNVYSVLLDKYGPGFSHICYAIADRDAYETVVKTYVDEGYVAIVQGRQFVYLEPNNGCNCILEFLCIPEDA